MVVVAEIIALPVTASAGSNFVIKAQSTGIGFNQVNAECTSTSYSSTMNIQQNMYGDTYVYMTFAYAVTDTCSGRQVSSGYASITPDFYGINGIYTAAWSGNVSVKVCPSNPESDCSDLKLYVIASESATSDVGTSVYNSRTTTPGGEKYASRQRSTYRNAVGSLKIIDVNLGGVFASGTGSGFLQKTTTKNRSK